MPHTSMLHVRVDEKLKSEASEKLANVGLTISDAVRILLTRVTKEGGLPVGLTTDDAAYDRWFKEKVEQALLSDLPTVSNESVMEDAKKLVERKLGAKN
ncbi:type II toxin-antitoxin system antitoxin, RelB/DinJ family [Idiomarina piscisalsi]|uniref:Type II toxin-antitoxin system antitoxin, RelB/DinJ family n=1 Tax=Idiomarina piscisalsi TaxID=1096243 RepID=A0ABM6LSV3_9GAMM|nr:type II toxin-antitoxin system RelB/DinJ family antitoxin [Idiomarina piscisalsi]ASG65663.1 type II toxin-antitoxin system antitoxin, RelB/DinJ family [Idiomarina piscisalsi]